MACADSIVKKTTVLPKETIDSSGKKRQEIQWSVRPSTLFIWLKNDFIKLLTLIYYEKFNYCSIMHYFLLVKYFLSIINS